MFGAIAGGIASALAGGAMSKLFGGGQKAASGGIFFQVEDGIRDYKVTGVQTCALPISAGAVAGPAPLHARRAAQGAGVNAMSDQAIGLLSLLATLACYAANKRVYRRHPHPLLMPIVATPMVLIALALPTHVRYPQYIDRKSTRLNSSHLVISYAVFCLKKKNPLGHTHPHLDSSNPTITTPPHIHSIYILPPFSSHDPSPQSLFRPVTHLMSPCIARVCI